MSNEETTKYQEGNQESNCSARMIPAQGSNSWKKLVIGGASGILLGAGGAVAYKTYMHRTGSVVADQLPETEDEDHIAEVIEDDSYDGVDVPDVIVVPEYETLGVNVAFVDDGMTFGEAFAVSREQVGPGGVFEWRGAIFNTFYVEEWEDMNANEKAEFMQQVFVTIGANEIDLDSMMADWNDNEVPMVMDDDVASDDAIVIETDGEVRILGMDEYDGHAVAVLDVDNDDVADFAIIDMDDDYELSNDDVVVYPDGDIASVEELIAEVEDLDDDLDDDEHFSQNPDVDGFGGDELFEI